MHIFVGLKHTKIIKNCAVTIGNFDSVHRGHQAVLALLRTESQQRQIPSCVVTFEPHPRDYFAGLYHKPQLAPARISTFRDKLINLRNCGIDQVLILPFKDKLAKMSAQDFVREILVKQLQTKFVLVGNDFLFGHQRTGDYNFLDQQGCQYGFAVGKMNSYEIHGQRVSSTMVRQELAAGNITKTVELLGHPYSITGHIVHGRKLGRELGFNTLNQRFNGWKPAASGIFVVKVHNLLGLTDRVRFGVANLGVRPSLDKNDVNGGRVLLETHIIDWPAELNDERLVYGKIIRVELLHKLHDELKYADLTALKQGIHNDIVEAKKWIKRY